jgi:DNA polymerase-3 subunit delta
MKKLTMASFGKYLSTTTTENLFVFHGEERFFIDQLIAQVEAYVFKGPGDKQAGYQTFYGTENTVSEIISACMSFSMFSDRKLVVVKEFDKLKTGDAESLIKYIHHPQKSTVLVFTADKWGNTKIFQEILNNAVSVLCRPFKDDEIYGWLNSKIKNVNSRADRESLLFLIENIGNNLLRLNTEIDKILNYIGPGNLITLDVVSQLTGFSREVNIFNFQRCLAVKKFEDSIKISMQLLEQGEALAGILPMLFGFFRKIWLVKTLRLKKMTNQEILKQLESTAFIYRDIFVAEKNFTLRQISMIMEKILEAEVQLKTSQKSNDSIMTMLCYHICHN